MKNPKTMVAGRGLALGHDRLFGALRPFKGEGWLESSTSTSRVDYFTQHNKCELLAE